MNLNRRVLWMTGLAAAAGAAGMGTAWWRYQPNAVGTEAETSFWASQFEGPNGETVDLSAWRGKPLLVYWWSSTCPFCAVQSPFMETLWRAQRGKGLQMLALSIDKQPEAATAYLAKKGYSFPAAWASPLWRKAFPKPKGLPITLLAGADGRLKAAEKGQMFEEDVLALAQLM